MNINTFNNIIRISHSRLTCIKKIIYDSELERLSSSNDPLHTRRGSAYVEKIKCSKNYQTKTPNTVLCMVKFNTLCRLSLQTTTWQFTVFSWVYYITGSENIT